MEITAEQQKWRSAMESRKMAQERAEQECIRLKAELELGRVSTTAALQNAQDSESELRAAKLECSLLASKRDIAERIDLMERDLKAQIAGLKV